MNLVCFDNMVLVWGIREQATSGQEEMVPRTKAFIKDLAEKRIRILIPSLVIAEFLMKIPVDMHPIVLNHFDRSFVMASFDPAAASMFARIWQNKKKEIIEDLANQGKTRNELKIDSLIVATAVSRHADCIYSRDKGVKAFAQDFIPVRDIPVIEKQAEMWSSESKREPNSPTSSEQPS